MKVDKAIAWWKVSEPALPGKRLKEIAAILDKHYDIKVPLYHLLRSQGVRQVDGNIRKQYQAAIDALRVLTDNERYASRDDIREDLLRLISVKDRRAEFKLKASHKTVTAMVNAQVKELYDYLKRHLMQPDTKVYSYIAQILNAYYSVEGKPPVKLDAKTVKKCHENALEKA